MRSIEKIIIRGQKDGVNIQLTSSSQQHLVLHFLQGGELIGIIGDAVRLEETAAGKSVEIAAGIYRCIEAGKKSGCRSDASGSRT